MNKRTFFERRISYIAILALLTSCIDKDKYLPESQNPMEEKPYFDFNLSSTLNLSVDYGTEGARAQIQLFDTEVILDDENKPAAGQNALFSVCLDDRGQFSGAIDIASTPDTVWLFSPDWLTPDLQMTVVNNGRASFTNHPKSKSTAKAWRKTADKLQIWPINVDDNLYSVVHWDPSNEAHRFGSFDDDNSIVSTISLNATTVKRLSTILGTDNKSDNRKYLAPTKNVNVTILPEVEVEENGTTVTKTVTDAEVSLTFIREAASYFNCIGYYYYPTDQVPDDPSSLRKYILLPNASQKNQKPFGARDDNRKHYLSSDEAPVELGTTVKLLYEQADGTFTTQFPPGITIGFFLMPDAYNPSWKISGSWTSQVNGQYNCIDYTQQPSISTIQTKNLNKGNYTVSNSYWRYSNSEWNSNAGVKTNGNSAFVRFQDAEGNMYYGIEDGVDFNFGDFAFMISASPNCAIKDEKVRNIDEEYIDVTELDYASTSSETFLFEDVWPTGGDYDLNDVIIEHKRTITYNGFNWVKSIVDEFTPVQPAGSATNVNAFAVRYPTGNNAQVKYTTQLSSGITQESGTNAYIVFSNTMASRNKPATITRTYTPAENFLVSNVTTLTGNKDYYPFVISQYSHNSDLGRTEVHLIGGKPTSLANTMVANSYYATQFVNEDGSYPFAINIPIVGFKPAAEKQPIGNAYPKFLLWRKSNGKNNGNWYK
ncbi:MAG: LruC domain-containing protein [Prevotella sp.]|nr:LruC domain-containing protein [Prevotella sp.]